MTPNHALQRIRPSRPGCNPTPRGPVAELGSLGGITRHAKYSGHKQIAASLLGFYIRVGGVKAKRTDGTED
jgi:hypothetical protein